MSRAEAFSRALQQTIAQGDEGVRVVIDGWRRALKNRWRRRAAVMLDHLPLLLIDADAATARQLAALARTTLAAIPANDHATVERAVEAFINALMASPAQIAVMAPVIRQYRVRLSRAEAWAYLRAVLDRA